MKKQSTSHDWNIGNTPPAIAKHSKTKHQILSSYLQRYVEVLTADPKVDRLKITLVDGFSGGGIYVDPEENGQIHLGSPFIMLNAMKEMEFLVQQNRTKQFQIDADFIFVERNRETAGFLIDAIRKSEHRHLLTSEKAVVLNSTFQKECDKIIQHTRKRSRSGKSIFLLDQCGYTSTPFSLIKNILSSLSKAEVILNFPIDFLTAFLNDTDEAARRLQKLDLDFPLELLKRYKEFKREDWILEVQKVLHTNMKLKTGAEYMTSFFIKPDVSNRMYWLPHFSNHLRAKEVMTDEHWKVANVFYHTGGPGTDMLGFSTTEHKSKFDVPLFADQFCFGEPEKEKSIQALVSQLPKIIRNLPEGISVSELYSHITNESPATIEILRDSLNELFHQREICLKSKDGVIRQSRVLANSDVIIPMKQVFVSSLF